MWPSQRLMSDHGVQLGLILGLIFVEGGKLENPELKNPQSTGEHQQQL